MSEGAADLVDHVLPAVPIRQWVLTLPFPLRFPLAFDGKLLGEVLRIFMDTVSGWRRARRSRVGQGQGGQALVPEGDTASARLTAGCPSASVARSQSSSAPTVISG